jgi:hypothetical protein
LTDEIDRQLELFGSPPPMPSDPREDRLGAFHGPAADAPATEREAAVAVFPRSGTSRWQVLLEIERAGDTGRSDYELACETGLRLYTAAPRRNELLNDGWIQDSGRRRPTDSGALAVVWILTANGRRWLDELDE